MRGYFYSADSAETLSDAYPAGFPGGQLAGGLTLRSISGIWIEDTVWSEPDDNGDQTIVTPGVRSEDYVVISAVEIPEWADYLIVPESETLA